MKTVLAMLGALPGLLRCAGALEIQSPDTAQTYSYHSIQWEQLRWLPREQAFIASITFSNLEYESRGEPRRDERFDFRFPGIRLDRKTGTFYALTKRGEPIPVATVERALIGKEIRLLPGSQIEIKTRSGMVHVEMTTGEDRSASAWAERGF